MSVEARRGCGYRKVGGLYLVSGGAGFPCDRLPIRLDVCPVCSHGFKQSRGFTWVDLFGLVGGDHENCQDENKPCPTCTPKLVGKAGLLWIGEKFYKTPGEFTHEGISLGFSRRIKAIPRGFTVGESWVLLAHPKTVVCPHCDSTGSTKEAMQNMIANGGMIISDLPKCETCKGDGKLPGIFGVWKPTRVEKLFRESERETDAVKDAISKGITPVFVPDNDKDHQGTVYDKAEDSEEETESETVGS